MLPLDALSTAVAVVAFVEFTCKFISTTNQVRKDGSSVKIQFVRDSTATLIALNAGLRDRRRLIEKDDSYLTQLEEGIDGILAGCNDVARELIELIARLSSSKHGFVESLRATFLTLLNKDKLEQMHAQLQAYRHDLNDYTIALLNEKLVKHSEDVSARLIRLEENQKESLLGQNKILEIVSFSRHTAVPRAVKTSDTVTASELAILRSQRSTVESQETTEKHHHIKDQKAVSAILVVSDERGNLSQVLLTAAESSDAMVTQPAGLIEQTTLFEQSNSRLHCHPTFSEPFLPVVRSVLGALNFETIRLREESIAVAHRRTFKWIFRKRKSSNDHKDNETPPYETGFRHFLESSNGIFWIQRKPGSGKSTLMKFISSHKRTKKCLNVWAESEQVLIATHFFMSQGTDLQGSLAGLLQSLLRTFLSRDQTLIPIAFPQACRQFLQEGSVDPSGFMVSDLRAALKRVLSVRPMRRKICLFLDGADEMSGPEEELGTLLHEIVGLPHVKAVVSSRPLAYFARLFVHRPTLRLQDLTRSDLRIYVDENLRTDQDMASLLDSDPSLGKELVEDITEKAAGVFLWVRLVVRSLWQGLLNGDSSRDLQKRLQEIPAEIEDFYDAMLDKMSPMYRRDAAMLFSILAYATEQRMLPVSLLSMSFAMDETLETAAEKPTKLMSPKKCKEICKTMEKRLFARTGGLMEVRRPKSGDRSSINWSVHFLHKTVLDFLDLPKTRRRLSVDLASFDANAALMAGCLLEIKVLPPKDAIIYGSTRASRNAMHCLSLASRYEVQWKRPCSAFLDELNTVMTEHWAAATHCKRDSDQADWTSTSDYHCWSDFVIRYGRPVGVMKALDLEVPHDEPVLNAFLALSAFYCCVLYVTNKTLAATYNVQVRTAFLAEIVCQNFEIRKSIRVIETADNRDLFSFNRMTAIKRLLDQGADPNSLLPNPLTPGMNWLRMKGLMGKVTIWEFYVLEILCICHFHPSDQAHKYTPDRVIQLYQLCTAFLCNGAHLSIFNIPDDDYGRSVVEEIDFHEYHELPRSFGAVLDRFRLATLDPKKRILVTSIQEGDIQRVEAAYQETLKAYQRRTLSGRILLGYESVRSKIEEVSRSSAFHSFCIFISGGLVFLVISRWLA